MIGLVATGRAAANGFQRAFLEEADCPVFDAGPDLAMALRRAGVDRPVALDAAALACLTEDGSALRDRAAQAALLGCRMRAVSDDTTLRQARAALPGGIILRPRSIGADPAGLHLSDIAPAAWAAMPAWAGDAVASPAGDLTGQLYLVETVSLGGRALVYDIARLRIDIKSGIPLLRHRISVPADAPERPALERRAHDGLARLGITEGAASILLSPDPNGPIEIAAAPADLSPSADAAFCAHGISHAHMTAEALLRPSEFTRRLEAPPRRYGLYLGAAAIPAAADPAGGASRLNGLRLVRRLTGFHSFTPLAAGQAIHAVVNFVHRDRASIENSMKVLHETVDSGAFFADTDDFISFAQDTRAAAQQN